MPMSVSPEPLAHRGKLVWATDADWIKHRETITRLYWDENKPLKEVSKIMKEEHDFHATDRMFKMRFSTWGLQKNLKKQDLQKIASEAYLNKKPTLPVVRGRQLGSRRLQKRVLKTTERSKYPLQSDTSSHALQHIRLAAPGSAGAAEKSVQAILEYTESRFQTRAWHVGGEYDFDSDTANSWWLNLNTAHKELVHGAQNGMLSPQGFKLLNSAFADYSRLLQNQHPQTVLATIAGYAGLHSVDPALGESLLNYVAGLSRIRLGPNHPYTRIWTNLRNTGAAQQTVSTLVNAHFDVMSIHAPGNNRFRLASLIQIIAGLKQAHMVSFESAYAALFKIASTTTSDVKAMRKKKKKTKVEDEEVKRPPEPDAFWVLLAQRYLCKFLLESGRPQEAETTMLAFEASHMESGNDTDHTAYLQVKVMVTGALGRTAESEAAMRLGYDITRCGQTLHPEYLMEYFATRLEDSYLARGDQAAADAFRAERDSHLGDMLAQGLIDEGSWRRMTRWRYVEGEDEEPAAVVDNLDQTPAEEEEE
ncbi:Clr5 domain-containing protein [Apiospora kogelbergensis]|uniref:Clr5 domain-containing protein n=1 Tax=Apiospora kogelbergensis TaxID=1337665 RepID=A0AAW0QY55_9PEZI